MVFRGTAKKEPPGELSIHGSSGGSCLPPIQQGVPPLAETGLFIASEFPGGHSHILFKVSDEDHITVISDLLCDAAHCHIGLKQKLLGALHPLFGDIIADVNAGIFGPKPGKIQGIEVETVRHRR